MRPAPVYLLDTNVVARLLAGDPPTEVAAARRAIDGAAAGQYALVVLPAVVAEIVYVLGKFYKQPRDEVVDGVRRVLRLPGIVVREAGVVERAFDLHVAHRKLKWVDAYLLALAEHEGVGVASLDRPLGRAAPAGVPILDPARA